MASFPLHADDLGQPKSSKSPRLRGRTVVKPILEKLHAFADRASLDLDRGWDDQPSPWFSLTDCIDRHGITGADLNHRSPRLTTESISLFPPGYRTSLAPQVGISHARSTSDASHHSVATTNSTCRNGPFVHPFQQTPQLSTPLISYSGQRGSLDNPDSTTSCRRSPAITERDDEEEDHGASNYILFSTPKPSVSSIRQLPSHLRPSLAGQRTVSEGGQALRPGAVRYGPESNPVSSSLNRIDLRLATAAAVSAPFPTESAQVGTPPLAPAVPAGQSCSSFSGSLPPLRSSLDMGSFRLRSRSEVDTVTRKELVREARRRFEAKERAKDEKYEREQMRKRDRAGSREAQRQEREQVRNRKESQVSLSSGSISAAATPRLSSLRRCAGTSRSASICEKRSTSYFDPESPPPDQNATSSIRFSSAKRAKAMKHRTMAVWTAFILWLRTRILKLRRR